MTKPRDVHLLPIEDLGGHVSLFGSIRKSSARNTLARALFALLLAGAGGSARAGTLAGYFSLEHSSFNPRIASLSVGRDGKLYMVSYAEHQTAYCLRLDPDGGNRGGSTVGRSVHFVVANKDGVMLVTHRVWDEQSVSIHDRNFRQTFERAYPLGGVPSVAVGESGDFYVRAGNVIVRLSPAGREVKRIPNPVPGDACLEVCEKAGLLYIHDQNCAVHLVDFDGKEIGKIQTGIIAWHGGWSGGQGGFDVDENGHLYVLRQNTKGIEITKIDKDELQATFPPVKSAITLSEKVGAVRWMRVTPTELLVCETDSPFLFRRFDRKTGKLLGGVRPRGLSLKIAYPGEFWESGATIPWSMEFNSGDTPVAPVFRVWARPLGGLDYRELTVADGKLRVPGDLGGLYQVKVSAEPDPIEQQAGSMAAAYGVIEVRAPGATGVISVHTPINRLWYGQGEAIPFSVAVSPAVKTPVQATVRLTDGERTISAWTASASGGQPAALEIPAAVTRCLRPGAYTLTPAAGGLTPAGQPLQVGPGARPTAMRGVLYADFGYTYGGPGYGLHHLTDRVELQMRYLERGGWNWVYDRWGDIRNSLYPENIAMPDWQTQAMADLQKRFATDTGVVKEKLQFGAFADQLVAAESALGVTRRVGLLGMDETLPANPGYDKVVAEIAARFKDYPAFAGFSWGALWWMGTGARDKAQAEAFNAAKETARATGKWDPIFDIVGAQRFALQTQTWARFNTILRGIKPTAVTGTAPPFKNYTCYPPETFANVDEVDLDQQFEQMSVPYHGPLMVDYYKRPGKPAWSHPELGNDLGTGDHFLPWLFLCAARGADGVGPQNRQPGWGYFQVDPREARAGINTGFMRINQFARAYGPWLKSLKPDDQVAIAVSRRLCLMTDWNNAVGSGYFNALTEAYIACLHAHHTARFMFTEDLGTQGFKPYKAVLLVNQLVEPEPELARALAEAQAAGVKVFADASCNAAFTKNFTPLGFAFQNLFHDVSHAGDDAAFWRFPQYARKNLSALRQALDAAAAPVADTDNDEVFFAHLRGEQGRFLFAVNNSMFHIDPGYMYRVSLYTAHRVPVEASVKLADASGAIYDVFAQKPVAPVNGAIGADLRVMPARIFAILPAAINRIELRGPAALTAGQAFDWTVRALDAAGKPIAASVPVAVRLTGAGGEVVEEQFAAAGSRGASGTLRLPVNAPAGTYRLEAAELLSGRGAGLTVAATAAALPLKAAPTDQAVAANSAGQPQAGHVPPFADGFGARARDLILTDGGKLAVINAFNWDQNVYGLDVETGAIRLRQRVGNYFAFSPHALPGGFAVQGYDLHAPEGYHVYLCGLDGKPERRFAACGLPSRLPGRFLPIPWDWDRENVHAVAPDGSWVAVGGDIGIAVWTRSGKLLWRLFGKDAPRNVRLAAMDERTLMVMDGPRVRLFSAADGKPGAEIAVAAAGEFLGAQFDRSRQICALFGTTDNGRIFILKSGQVVADFPVAQGGDRFSGEFHLSEDGRYIAATANCTLRFYSVEKGLLWTFSGDEQLRSPHVSSPDGRVAVSSALGTLSVFSADGHRLLERSLGTLCRPFWLPDGDLLIASWIGPVFRLDKEYKEKWRAWLIPTEPDMREKILAKDTTPTAHIPDWSNAEAKPAAITPNLLAQTPVKMSAPGIRGGLVNKPELLFDGLSAPPPRPWLDWSGLNYACENFANTILEFDAQGKLLEVSAVTFFENPDQPQSWLRDVALQYWNPEKNFWEHAVTCRADAPVHTHRLAAPVTGGKFRLVLKPGSNPRLAEVVLHGTLRAAAAPAPASGGRASAPVGPPSLIDNGNIIR